MFEVIEWEVISRLIELTFSIRYTKKSGKPDLFGREGELWIKVDDYEELENIEILSCLEEIKGFEGDLYIITDASYRETLGPFKVKATDIHEFTDNYWNEFGEYFANTDLLIFNFELKLVWIFHHSGFYSVVNFAT